MTAINEALKFADNALATAQEWKATYEGKMAMIDRIAKVAAEGRKMGKSPAALTDALVKDLTRIAAGPLDKPSDVRATLDVVYGRSVIDPMMAEADFMSDLLGTLMGIKK